MLGDSLDKIQDQTRKLFEKPKGNTALILHIKKSTIQLKNISDKLEPGGAPINNNRLKLLHEKLQSDNFLDTLASIQAVRKISEYYSIRTDEGTSIMENAMMHDRALELIAQQGIGDVRIFRGMVNNLIKVWQTKYEEELFKLVNILAKAIEISSERNEKLLNNMQFFKGKDGPRRLTEQFKFKNFTHLMQDVGLPDFFWQEQYFQVCLAEYFYYHCYENDRLTTIVENLINDTNQSLGLFNKKAHEATRLACYSFIIEGVSNGQGNAHIKDWIKIKTLEEFGDPSTSAKWNISSGVSVYFSDQINSAKSILDLWINEELFETFFRFIEDKRRKDFWQRYLKQMANVKLLMDISIFNRLPDNFKNSTEIRGRLRRINSGVLLYFQLGNMSFIEFGKQAGGSLQVWKSNNPKVGQLNRELDEYSFAYRRIRRNQSLHISRIQYYRIDKVLIPWMDWREERRDFTIDQGHFAHAGYWEDRLKPWLNRRGIYAN